MNDGPLECATLNLNSSGFDDDSIVSDNEDFNRKNDGHFIIKSESHKSMEEDIKKEKNNSNNNLEITNPDKKDE